jgi:hypothetical protein
LVLRDKLCAIDSGCVWGNQLSAVPLDLDPGKRIPVQVECTKIGVELRTGVPVLLDAP